ncbi:MAG TPA: nucleotidyltransferase domain-containing protein [Candidatus Bathyarchaeia archaeon]|nr:nucleotidyltransferase domain-containing protein [Candidatus Bathyarchaeia archaeon]
MSAKPERRAEIKEVQYNSARWDLLKEFRAKATEVMTALEQFHMHPIVHGSIARGDVTKKSDVDVFVAEPPSSFILESALEKANLPIISRFIVQATPNYAMKGNIMVDEKASVSFPLMSMRRVEREFYRFGGEASLNQLRENIRVAGVDKRLMLIEPTEAGHVENSILGREEHVAKVLGISVETVLDRVHALMKRDEVGRTGVFIKRELAADETFELALKKMAEENPAVRRRMRTGN